MTPPNITNQTIYQTNDERTGTAKFLRTEVRELNLSARQSSYRNVMEEHQ